MRIVASLQDRVDQQSSQLRFTLPGQFAPAAKLARLADANIHALVLPSPAPWLGPAALRLGAQRSHPPAMRRHRSRVQSRNGPHAAPLPQRGSLGSRSKRRAAPRPDWRLDWSACPRSISPLLPASSRAPAGCWRGEPVRRQRADWTSRLMSPCSAPAISLRNSVPLTCTSPR